MSRKMMLVSVLLAMAVVAPGLAPAEDNAAGTGKKPMEKGLKVGLNMATFSGSNAKVTAPDTKASRIALVFGAYAGFGAGPITIQPEVLYSNKGSKVKGDVLGVTWTATTQLAYIDVPVLFKYELTPAPTKLAIFAGPSLGILMGAKEDVSVSILSSPSVDIKEFCNSVDLGLVVGAGVGLAGFNLDVRYQMGLSPVYKTVAGVTPKIYNSTISLMVAIPL